MYAYAYVVPGLIVTWIYADVVALSKSGKTQRVGGGGNKIWVFEYTLLPGESVWLHQRGYSVIKISDPLCGFDISGLGVLSPRLLAQSLGLAASHFASPGLPLSICEQGTVVPPECSVRARKKFN